MATQSKLSNDQIVKIYLDAISGEKSLSEIAKEYNVSPATVRRIKNKELKKYALAIDEYFKSQSESAVVAEEEAISASSEQEKGEDPFFYIEIKSKEDAEKFVGIPIKIELDDELYIEIKIDKKGS